MPPSTAMTEVSLAIRVLVSLVFLTAAYGKFRHLTALQGVVANYRLIPDMLVVPVAYLLAPVEALLGTALLLGLGSPWPELGAAALLTLFAAAMGINMARGRRHIDCGCFQSALKQTLNWTLVFRNVVLAMLLGVAILAPGLPNDLYMIVNGCLVGGVLFVILQSLTMLWSIVPAWQRRSHDAHNHEAGAGT
ncbi:MAG: MauE/DoxX family redox-associated membrane protein [Gammaproteobacteria bacterium]